MRGEALNRCMPISVGLAGFTRPMNPNVASSFEQIWDTAMSSMIPRSYDGVLRRVAAYELARWWKRSWVNHGVKRPHRL